jgi:SAM-dependent methyltransferase
LRLGEVAAVALRSAAAAPAGDELVIGEPLCTSAPLARIIASAVCRPVGAGDSDCSSYHGLIQYVRLLGLVGTPERNGHFYRECFQAVARQGGRRVLVSGAADYNMLAHVLAAYDGIGKRPRVTVLDRCATPLFMSRWYADVRGVGIRTEQADIGGFADAEPYDLICTDSLLTVLDPEQKRRAAAAWARLLAPAGRVITTARIAPDSPDGPVRLAPDRVKAFAEDVREQARRRAGLLDVDPEVLAEEARSYGAGVTVYPFRSTEELVAVFNEASLEVERLDVADVGGRVPRERAGPGGHAPARYARVVGRAR